MKKYFDQKITLITSGSKGFGYELCKHFSQFPNNHVIMASKSRKEGERSRTALEKEVGVKLSYIEMNKNDPDSLDRTLSMVRSKFGKLDILINNESFTFTELTKFLDVQVKTFIQTFALNISSSFYTMKAFLPLMKENKYGRIVNVGSCIGNLESMREPMLSCYLLSQFSLKSLTKILSEAVNPKQIKINAFDLNYSLYKYKKHKQLDEWNIANQEKLIKNTGIAPFIHYLTQLDDNGPTGSYFEDPKAIGPSTLNKLC
ncbi:alcohol dehydrogenase [Anaeramoeba flamelloides]|uniref:Alcohol dehydrogenase n=1 Tax=Anaeramoeba flamelloides TaxID=1746091 RepID=A0AAV8A0A6_9EUKA|nr:alcohol dehydrogenase [Anaeramoeba flamelloides]KAJ6232528.1 alcohol dehydrogenase [Anaeramoeba flamelloides]